MPKRVPNQYDMATPLTRQQKLYLIVMQGVGSFAINFVVNFIINWKIFPDPENYYVPFAGNITCIVSVIIVTTLIECLACCLIGTVLTRLDLRSRKVIVPGDPKILTHPYLSWIPNRLGFLNKRGVFPRAIILTLLFIGLFDPITLLILGLVIRDGGFKLQWGFCIFMGFWCGLMGALITPLNTLILVCSPDHQRVVTEDFDPESAQHHASAQNVPPSNINGPAIVEALTPPSERIGYRV
eukprot:TRINITY_DN444_c0_g1_i1.p1 TRINITY_DN444_c0_g1~~TRINITY_DN444_c0_g1_i1.p1  ORF type:complete len:240 (+),score=46.98 TRINITY_DN444_c0_g1_i1:38-757(+)